LHKTKKFLLFVQWVIFYGPDAFKAMKKKKEFPILIGFSMLGGSISSGSDLDTKNFWQLLLRTRMSNLLLQQAWKSTMLRILCLRPSILKNSKWLKKDLKSMLSLGENTPNSWRMIQGFELYLSKKERWLGTLRNFWKVIIAWTMDFTKKTHFKLELNLLMPSISWKTQLLYQSMMFKLS